jgi:NAD(P)-dependent dehydrogenase (short-subunit alcohol dehydrogenase family)
MAGRLHGKRAVIVGGNSGIGLSSAEAFVREGAKVLITGRDPKTLDAAVAGVGGGTIGVQCDISRMADIDVLAAAAADAFEQVDVLFINAGIGRFSPIEQVTEANWDELMGANLKGVFFTFQKLLPLLPPEGASVILNSSIGWLKGLPTNSVYAASKAGVRALGRNFACELVGRNIRVNVISPGPVETPIISRTPGLPPEAIPAMRERMIHDIPMHRMGRPEEVASVAVFLASDESSFITGIDVLVDGGLGSF